MAFVKAKATSVNSLAAGLSVRFLSVKWHIGFRVARMSTAIAVSTGCFCGSLSIAPGNMVRNGPFAAIMLRAYAEGVPVEGQPPRSGALPPPTPMLPRGRSRENSFRPRAKDRAISPKCRNSGRCHALTTPVHLRTKAKTTDREIVYGISSKRNHDKGPHR
jgi:hypothetical protein